ncbi:putative bifunctional diguanylate cyclase/phosphodiesterase [Sporichthya polymorpha]|uniref:putative bifunctional diguanylate cyclase/phosphodiesterase n=1 Tax=Sporichthya polymorpha TaxID=35751 RepID=UPI0012EBB041|nr:EAL domain-containing protein [Sporichthya polymorpha]
MTGTRAVERRGASRRGLAALLTARGTRILGLIVFLLATGTALLVWSPALEDKAPGPTHLPWWAMVLMFGVAEMVVLHIQIRREAQTVSLSEIPLVVGLFMAGPEGLLIGRVVGSLLIFVFHRRQAPIKVAFNTALVFASGALALTIWSLAFNGQEAGPEAWAAAFAALVAAGSFDATITTMAIACYEGRIKISRMAREVASAGTLAAAVGTVGLVAATAVTYDVRSAFLVEAAGALLLLGYRAYASLRERHESLEQLYHFSEVVSGAHDVDTVLRSVLAQARQLLRSDRAEFLSFDFPGGLAPARMSLLPDGVQRDGVAEVGLAAFDADPVVARVRRERRSVLLARTTKDAAEKEYLAEHGLREAIVVPLHMDGVIVGTLSVGNRLGEVRGFDAGDVRLLETVANHAGVALKSGSLIARLSHEAHHDTLTGLPNRHLLQQELDAAIAAVRLGTSVGCAVMISDLNGFKEVNDTLGHQHGDQLLRDVARQFVEVAGTRALVARLGGDEFAVLLTDVASPAEAASMAQAMVDSLAAPMRLDGVSVEVSASIGVAMAPLHGEDVSGLLKRADVAMYAAKANGGGVRFYDEGLQEAANPSRLALVGELRAAIKDGGIEAWVQPKASLVDGSIVGVEALARWRHPVDGIRGPAEFLPVAEANGMIGPLTEAMLDSSLSACSAWLRRGIEAGVAVNVSPRSLRDTSFAETVSSVLARHDVPAHLLTLEITETSLMADSPQAIDVLVRLNALGVRLSIDDFGTGYSSLAYLRRLPVNEIKIDREFTSRIESDPRVLTIVRSVADLARNIGMQTVAEGVEDSDVFARLQELGVGQAQGYHISRPMPAAEFPAWLDRYNEDLNGPRPLLPGGRRPRSHAAA